MILKDKLFFFIQTRIASLKCLYNIYGKILSKNQDHYIRRVKYLHKNEYCWLILDILMHNE